MNLATLAERNLAEYGDYDRLFFEGKTHTNRELYERSTRLASALLSLGLGLEDKVVVMMPNCAEVLVSYPAIWRAGMTAIPGPIPARVPRAQIHPRKLGREGDHHVAGDSLHGRGRDQRYAPARARHRDRRRRYGTARMLVVRRIGCRAPADARPSRSAAPTTWRPSSTRAAPPDNRRA